MCADSHQYRPLAANRGGSGTAIDPDFEPQVSTVVSTASTQAPNDKSPTSVQVLVRLHFARVPRQGLEPRTY